MFAFLTIRVRLCLLLMIAVSENALLARFWLHSMFAVEEDSARELFMILQHYRKLLGSFSLP